MYIHTVMIVASCEITTMLNMHYVPSVQLHMIWMGVYYTVVFICACCGHALYHILMDVYTTVIC